jgi:hypothetical protein
MFSRRSLITIVAASATLMAGHAFAQGQAIVGIQTTTTYSIDGRIAAVDANARTVTITSTDGSSRTLNVSSAAVNLASTRVGDNVSASIEDTRTFVLSGPNTKTPQPGRTAAAIALESGQNVTGAAASTSIGNWWVVGVNPAANTITLVSPNSGPVRTYNVTSEAGRQQLPRVKVGDSLTQINDRLAVASITPKG